MSEKQPPNLDQLAAQTAQKIVRQAGPNVENLVQKALGVLQENGVYACLLFLLSRTSDEKRQAEQSIVPGLIEVLEQDGLESLGLAYRGPKDFDNGKDRTATRQLLEHFADNICDDLDKLFLIKELYEQTLIYARYGAKAAKVEVEAKK